MLGEAFEVQRLDAPGGEAGQHLGLARARAAVQQDDGQVVAGAVEARLHAASPGAVAAVQYGDRPADLVHDRRHRPGPLAASPAVHQWPERAIAVGERPVQMGGDVPRHLGRADAAGEEL